MLLGSFLIGLWLGWLLWSRYKRAVEKLTLDNSSLTAGIDALRVELNTAKTQAANMESENLNYAAQVASLNRNNANLRDRISELELELAAVSDRNRQVETELGLAFDATPDQPALELEIDAPMPTVEPVADIDIPLDLPEPVVVDIPEASPEPEVLELVVPPVVVANVPAIVAMEEEEKPENPAPKAKKANAEPLVLAPLPNEKDDLTVVEGIGPKIQMLLNQYGIYTYRQLATTEVARLKEILQAAGPQLAMHDPGTWPSQANLAANDEWDSLKSIQGFLKGGKKPT